MALFYHFKKQFETGFEKDQIFALGGKTTIIRA
jgi:hypothetical protein